MASFLLSFGWTNVYRMHNANGFKSQAMHNMWIHFLNSVLSYRLI